MNNSEEVREILMKSEEREKTITYICRCEDRKCQLEVYHINKDLHPLELPKKCLFNEFKESNWFPRVCNNCQYYAEEIIRDNRHGEPLGSYEYCARSDKKVTFDSGCNGWEYNPHFIHPF